MRKLFMGFAAVMLVGIGLTMLLNGQVINGFGLLAGGVLVGLSLFFGQAMGPFANTSFLKGFVRDPYETMFDTAVDHYFPDKKASSGEQAQFDADAAFERYKAQQAAAPSDAASAPASAPPAAATPAAPPPAFGRKGL